nr:hypothetical protein [Tanacetum cinerariifolium]
MDDTVTDYSRPSPTIASTSAEGQNKDTSTSENVASPNPPNPFVKFVKPKDNQPKSEGSKGRQLGLKIIHIGALHIDLVVTDHTVLLCDLHSDLLVIDHMGLL